MNKDFYEFVEKIKELREKDINRFYEIKGILEGLLMAQEISLKETVKRRKNV